MVLAVLEPEQLRGHALSPQLDVDVLPVRSGPDDALRHHWREQQLLKPVVVELVGERPGQARRHSTHDVVGHGRDGNAERGTHLATAEPFTEAQPEDISDLAHGDTGSGQLLLLGRVVRGACRAGPTSRQLLRESPQRVYENVGIGVRIRSERVYGMARNPHPVKLVSYATNSSRSPNSLGGANAGWFLYQIGYTGGWPPVAGAPAEPPTCLDRFPRMRWTSPT